MQLALGGRHSMMLPQAQPSSFRRKCSLIANQSPLLPCELNVFKVPGSRLRVTGSSHRATANTEITEVSEKKPGHRLRDEPGLIIFILISLIQVHEIRSNQTVRRRNRSPPTTAIPPKVIRPGQKAAGRAATGTRVVSVAPSKKVAVEGLPGSLPVFATNP